MDFNRSYTRLGSCNQEADVKSRVLLDENEWKHNPSLCKRIVKDFEKHGIDLFSFKNQSTNREIFIMASGTECSGSQCFLMQLR